MSANPQALMQAMQQQQPPSTQLPPLANSLVAGQPPQPQPLPQLPQPAPFPKSVASDIDPQVLARQVKIKIDGASRMLSRDILAQNIQFLYPLIMNGPFLQQLMQSGYTVDFLVLAKMMQDATGTAKAYPWVRPLNQQEEQRMQQGPPQMRAQQQMKMQEIQGRKDIMQMKVQGEQQKQQMKDDFDRHKVSEESARHIIEQILNSGGPEAKMLEARMKMMEGQQKLQHQQQSHAMDLQHQARQHQMDMQQQTQQNAMDAQTQRQQMGFDMQRAALDHQVGQMQGQAKVNQIMTQARAQQAAGRMKLQHQQQSHEARMKQQAARPKGKV